MRLAKSALREDQNKAFFAWSSGARKEEAGQDDRLAYLESIYYGTTFLCRLINTNEARRYAPGLLAISRSCEKVEG